MEGKTLYKKKIFKKKPIRARNIMEVSSWTASWRIKQVHINKLLLMNNLKKYIYKFMQQDLIHNNILRSKNDFNNLYTKAYMGINKNASESKLKNFCYYVGRARAVNRDLYMTRHVLRKFGRFGCLPGLIRNNQ